MSVRTFQTQTIDCATRVGSSSVRLHSTARLATVVRRGWNAYWQRRARRATMLLLASLDERTLRDIGLSPSEISSAVYGAPDRLRSYGVGCPVRSGNGEPRI